jgi:thiamine monophosphate kinase
MGAEKRSEYQKSYKKYHYKKTRKIITFPLLLEEFETLKTKADKIGTSSNKLAKEILLNHLEAQPQNFQSKEQLDLIKEYMRISRGIATNINQIAHSSNIGEVVDINILIGSLKNYEDEFKTLVSKFV